MRKRYSHFSLDDLFCNASCQEARHNNSAANLASSKAQAEALIALSKADASPPMNMAPVLIGSAIVALIIVIVATKK